MTSSSYRLLKRRLRSAFDETRVRLFPRDTKPGGHFKGAYLLLSGDPPILYVADWVIRGRAFGIDRMFRGLKRRRAYFFVRLSWSHETRPYAVDQLRDWTVLHRRRFPGHRIIWLCNTRAEESLFREKQLEAIFCSHNAFCDERIYRPLPDVEREFDAVYDARISAFKRHSLAADLASLALISKRVGEANIGAYEDETRRALAHAHWFNDPLRPDFAVLTPEEVNEALNRCRVGLCLSAQEGAMMASIQYLLAGLPVVSTPSIGGRDVFFDDEFTRIVDANPQAVARGVAELIERRMPPQRVRAVALDRVMEHRRRLVAFIQSIYDAEGVRRDFAGEWSGLFRNYLLDPDTDDAEILESIRAASRRRG